MALDISKEENPKTKTKLNFKVWIKILKYTFKRWPLLIILLLTILITSFYDVSFIPLMNAAAINTLTELNGNFVPLNELLFQITIFGINFPLINFYGYIIILFVAILLRSIAIFFTFFITNYLEMDIMVSLRRDSFRVVQQLSFSYFDKTPSGWLIARMQNDTATIGDVLSWGIIRILWITAELIFTLITMFTVNWLLSIIILSMAQIIFVVVAYFNKIILERHRIARNAYSNFVRWLAECISGVQTIKTLAIEDRVYNEEEEITEEVRQKRLKAFIPNAFFTPIFSILSAITTAVIILVGAYIYQDVISIATLVLFIGFVGSIYNPLSQFSELFADFVATQANIEKIISLIETKPTITDTCEVIEKYGTIFNNKTENFEPIIGDIIYDHVSFSYNENIEVLHDLSLHIKQGTSLAIVGETGSGKSTTVNLLCRFYEPTKGRILIDGVDYKNRSQGWLRSNIGYVQQTPFVFQTSFKNNVKYGKLDASDEEVINACKIVGIHDFIMSFKDGYDTVLNDSGNQLSLGQKQLISFARAIIRNPSIMILDEATSSIDTETEKQIQDAMNKILKGRTSLIIAHRLSTIVECDRILVMRDGRVVEDGNHISLMKKKGYYYELYMNQFKQLNLEQQLNTYNEQIKKKGL